MVTFLIVLMMMCNLWILFYLTWEQQERQKAGSQENTDRKRQEPPPDVVGRSKFKISDWIGTEKNTTVPGSATSEEAEAEEEGEMEKDENTGLEGDIKEPLGAGSCHFRGSRGGGRKGRYLCR